MKRQTCTQPAFRRSFRAMIRSGQVWSTVTCPNFHSGSQNIRSRLATKFAAAR